MMSRSTILTRVSLLVWPVLGACAGGDAPPTEPPPVTVTRVSVGPSGLSLEVGQTQRMSATVHYSDGSSQTSEATWASSAPSVATVSSSGVVTAVSTGDAIISATVSGQTGSEPVSVMTVWCEEPVTLTLGVGEHGTLPIGECALITAQTAGEYYRVAVTRPVSSENSSDVSAVVLETRAGSAGRDGKSSAVAVSANSPTGPPPSALVRMPDARIDGTALIEELRMTERTHRAHRRMMAEAARDFGGLTAQALRPRDPPTEVADALTSPPDRLGINSGFSCSGSFDPHLLIGFNDHVAVYQDSTLWAKERMSSTSAGELTSYFETAVVDMINEYFGELTDLDSNGRVVVTTSPTIGDSISGIVWTGDFFPRSSCAGSNEGEFIYLNDSLVHRLDDASPGWYILGTLAHETQHVVSLQQRVATRQELHPSWIEEGRAELAGELAGRFQWRHEGGPELGVEVDAETLLNNLCLSPSNCRFTRETYPIVQQLANLIIHLSTHPNSLVTNPDGANEYHSIYASGWHFTRFLVDGFAEAAGGTVGDFTKRLVDGSTTTGIPGLRSVTGRDYRELLSDLLLSMSFHSTSGITHGPGITSYDLATVTKIFSAPDVLVTTGTYPWPLTASADDVNHMPFTDRRIEGLTGPSGFRFHDFRAGAPGETLRMAVATREPAMVVITRRY